MVAYVLRFLFLHLEVSGGEWTSQAKWRPWWSGAGGAAGVWGAHTTSLCVCQRGQGQRFHIPLWHKGKFFKVYLLLSLLEKLTAYLTSIFEEDKWYENICRKIPEKNDWQNLEMQIYKILNRKFLKFDKNRINLIYSCWVLYLIRDVEE